MTNQCRCKERQEFSCSFHEQSFVLLGWSGPSPPVWISSLLPRQLGIHRCLRWKENKKQRLLLKKSKLEMPNKKKQNNKKKPPTCSGQQWGPSRMWGGSHHTCGRTQRMYFWVWTARKLARGGRQGKPCYHQKSYHCERSWVSHTGRTGQRLAPVWLLEEEQWLEVKKIRKTVSIRFIQIFRMCVC